jgi:septal ring factor EnvC (AmiA/AmiB activator)
LLTQSYVAEDKSGTGRTLIIESPKHSGWDLIEPKSAKETTDTLYRFEGKLEPKQVSELKVKEQHIERQSLAMLQLDVDSLIAYSRNASIPPAVRDAIRKAADLNSALTTTRRDIQQRQQKINDITQEQSRIRENMKSVNPNSSYSKRLLQELDDQETTIQNLQTEIQKLQTQANDQQKSLEDYLANLTIG